MLHTEKWFKMGPMKPKTYPTCRQSAFVIPLESESAATAWSDRKDASSYLWSLCLCTFFIQRHNCDKGAAMFPFLPERAYEPGKKTNICIEFAFLLVWWPHFSWNRDPYMTCSHRGNEHGKVRCILTPHIYHSSYCVYQFHLLRLVLLFILSKPDFWIPICVNIFLMFDLLVFISYFVEILKY